ncbi:MerR family transcriptional regulator [Phytohabitans rumicis]|uniref:MerR family transcriptional regulator n=1 Tax=Phytohabitans rumicis TaxID=1076125 RepID=UPI00248451D5|nr:MerR family transcriptional regulator [Phytohabitans rumicis]
MLDGKLPRWPSRAGDQLRISELSRETGVPVATIKFYVRERLLPPGTPTGRNQAEYNHGHLRRLGLIRALTIMGQLDLSSVRELLTAIEDETLPLSDLYEVLNQALFPDDPAFSDPDGVRRAENDVDGFIKSLGWQVEHDTSGRAHLIHVLSSLQRLGCDCGVEFFTPYADAAERLAEQELGLVPTEDVGRSDRAAAVVRAVLLDVAMSAIRRMAKAHLLSGDPARREMSATADG